MNMRARKIWADIPPATIPIVKIEKLFPTSFLGTGVFELA